MTIGHLPPGPRLAGPPLSVCDVSIHNDRDTGDDCGKLYVAPEVSGSGSHTSRILHLLAPEVTWPMLMQMKGERGGATCTSESGCIWSAVQSARGFADKLKPAFPTIT